MDAVLLQDLKVKDLRQIIERENLPISWHTGGLACRTKVDIANDIARARQLRRRDKHSTPAVPSKQGESHTREALDSLTKEMSALTAEIKALDEKTTGKCDQPVKNDNMKYCSIGCASGILLTMLMVVWMLLDKPGACNSNSNMVLMLSSSELG